MALWVLMGVAALVYSVLTGLMEGRGARRAQQRILARTSTLLHPLPRHGYRRLHASISGRALHHMVLFIGFLVVAYAVAVLLRLLWAVLALWF